MSARNATALIARALLVVVSLASASATRADESPSQQFFVKNLGTIAAIRIDGAKDEAWQAAPPNSDFTEYYPRIGEPAAARTEFRLARDATYLYVIAELFDPHISLLRSGYARRDGYLDEQDWLQILIDPLGSRRVAQGIAVNPHGVVRDGVWNDEAGTFNDAADFEVKVATRLYANSWVVELRIPFTQLRYTSSEASDWNLLVRRNMPRRERWAMSAPSVKSAPCLLCFAAPIIGLGTLPLPQSLELVPQLLTRSRSESGEVGGLDRHLEVKPTLEAKYRLSPSTVVDATLNPDFSQLELDVPQLSSNLQFAVSLPEKRPFFIEGLDILETPLRAIYTRSITSPAWGLRATHRGQWDGVLISTLDEGGGVVALPGSMSTAFAAQDFSSYVTIGRVRLPLDTLTLGALVTDRRNGGEYNTVAGPDVVWFPSRQTRIRAQWLASRTAGGDSIPAVGDAGNGAADGRSMSLGVLRETRHWRSELEYQQSDDQFRADAGFIPQVGIRKIAGALQYKILELPVVSELAPYIGADVREDLAGRSVSEASRIGFQARLPRNSVLTAELRPQQSARLRADTPLRSVQQGMIALSSSPFAQIASVGLIATMGQTLDVSTDRVASGESLTASALIRPSASLEIEPRIDLAVLRTDLGDSVQLQAASERAAQLRTTVHFSARNRLRLILQSTAVHRDDRNLRIRLVDQSSFTGSLLFTHERSLLSRLYAGVSFARNAADDPLVRDEMEVFVKVQTAISPLRGSAD